MKELLYNTEKHMKVKNYNYQILKESNLIIKSYQGTISLSEMYDYVESTSRAADFSAKFNVINDIRDASFILDKVVLLELIQKFKKNKLVYGQRKIVFITSTPNQVVFSTMLNMFKDESNINISVVSTLSAAMNRLNIPISEFSHLDNILHKMQW